MTLVDLHVHTAPSLLPRHHTDLEIVSELHALDIDAFVLKAHEGSTAERAVLIGNGAIGSVVLNSPVGGANPDAIVVAGEFGARVAWMPTNSAEAHRAAAASAELAAHRKVHFRPVPVTANSHVRPEWLEVFDVVAQYDMVLGSGHITLDETIAVFQEAQRRGVRRFLVNHPMMPFLGWRDEHADQLARIGAYLEVGVLADHGARPGEAATDHLAGVYSTSLLVFGSDLGHTDYPSASRGIAEWLASARRTFGDTFVELVAGKNGRELLTR